MKFVAICLMTLLAIALANQSTMRTSTSSERLDQVKKQSDYAKLLINVIQMHVESKGAISTILNVLDEIKAEHLDNIAEAEAYVTHMKAYYPNYLSQVQAIINTA